MSKIIHSEKRGRRGWIRALPFLFLCHVSPAPADEIPHVSAEARESYASGYRHAGPHKAFAIAPGGGWSWRADHPDARSAADAAIAACGEHTPQTCLLFDLDGQRVLDTERWPTLWRPYPTPEQAATRNIGTARGERFPDLAFRDSRGRPMSLADFRGKVVLLHFWGSWCPPCMGEFPSLLQLQDELKSVPGEPVSMVLLQTREPFSDSLRWARRNEFGALPLYDSGVKDDEQSDLTTSDGQRIADRMLSPRFPTSYILDRNGVILFRHKGPIDDWSEYLPFFRDVVENSATP